MQLLLSGVPGMVGFLVLRSYLTRLTLYPRTIVYKSQPGHRQTLRSTQTDTRSNSRETDSRKRTGTCQASIPTVLYLLSLGLSVWLDGSLERTVTDTQYDLWLRVCGHGWCLHFHFQCELSFCFSHSAPLGVTVPPYNRYRLFSLPNIKITRS